MYIGTLNSPTSKYYLRGKMLLLPLMLKRAHLSGKISIVA